ncbi:MAG TPA: EamA family transporter [Opitutus sp.]|nr:EamA family transporter [Opitutus sp.]
MFLLLLVSFIWAFSFGLIGNKLAGVDPTAIAVLRLALALLAFLPFFRRGALDARTALRLVLIGAVQFGAMYLLYLRAYLDLPSYAVALFTITTPLYVALFDAALERRWRVRFVLAALLAIAGAGLLVFASSIAGKNVPRGILLVQLSNICFAAGQLAWRRARTHLPAAVSDASVFALPYAGAFAVSAGLSIFTVQWSAVHLTPAQVMIILYLGILASGVCFFWWNVGATHVNAGTLAAFNNAKIPLAVACSLIFFHEQADLPRLLVSGVLLALAVWIARRRTAPS